MRRIVTRVVTLGKFERRNADRRDGPKKKQGAFQPLVLKLHHGGLAWPP